MTHLLLYFQLMLATNMILASLEVYVAHSVCYNGMIVCLKNDVAKNACNGF